MSVFFLKCIQKILVDPLRIGNKCFYYQEQNAFENKKRFLL